MVDRASGDARRPNSGWRRAAFVALVANFVAVSSPER
jgi:hypothetical protein